MNAQRIFHLHMIADAARDDLGKIAAEVAAQQPHLQTLHHNHPPVRSRKELDAILGVLQTSPGIVLYSLSDPKLVAALEQACRRLNMPCIGAPISTGDAPKMRRWPRVLVLGLVGIALVWEISTRSLGAYWAESDTEMAMSLPATHPKAFVDVAAAKLAKLESAEAERDEAEKSGPDARGTVAQDSGAESDPKTLDAPDSNPTETQAQIEVWLKSALRRDPLNARAFRLLGQLANRESDEVQTSRLMQAAARRSLHESNATYYVMRKSYEDANYGTALRYADALLRDRPNAAKEVMPILGTIAEDEREGKQLQRMLATNPPWRNEFFNSLPRYISDARTPLKIALGLRHSPAPMQPQELKSYLEFLVRKGFEDLAYYTWLQFLPEGALNKVGRLFNGDFEAEPSGLPFDWTFTDGSNVSIRRAKRPEQENHYALLLDFGSGRVSSLGVSQLVMLPPGAYRFEGKVLAEISSARGLQWRVACEGKGTTTLGESSPVVQGSGIEWQAFDFSFTVPETGCAAQRVELFFNARWTSEQFITGSIWYDDLKVEAN